jgi:hypothetical protein
MSGCGLVIDCDHCGEAILDKDPSAELYDPLSPRKKSVIVHAEPCAMEMIDKGWEIA